MRKRARRPLCYVRCLHRYIVTAPLSSVEPGDEALIIARQFESVKRRPLSRRPLMARSFDHLARLIYGGRRSGDLRVLLLLSLQVLNITEQDFMGKLGESFVDFVAQYGYDRVLSVLGRHMRDFLNGESFHFITLPRRVAPLRCSTRIQRRPRMPRPPKAFKCAY